MLFSLLGLELLHSKKSQNSKCTKRNNRIVPQMHGGIFLLMFFFLLLHISHCNVLTWHCKKISRSRGTEKMKIKKIAKFDYHSLSSNNVGFFLFFVRLVCRLGGIDNTTVRIYGFEKRTVILFSLKQSLYKETK